MAHPQDVAQALLAACLAVGSERIDPSRAASLIAEVVAQPGRSWFGLLAEWQILNATEIQELQAQVAQHLRLYGTEPEEFLAPCVVDLRLQKELDGRQLPQIDSLLRFTRAADSSTVQSGQTELGDHFVTLASHAPSVPDVEHDPYTTGAFGGVAETANSPPITMAPATQAILPVAGTLPISPTPGSAGTDPTQSDRRVIPSNTMLEVEEPADYTTQAPSATGFDSLSKATSPPGGEYATLTSGVMNVPETRGASPYDHDTLPWPLRFRVLREHAKGGLGKVSVAEDLELHREVAFKEIQRRYADDTEARARFLLEAEITGGLEHPGIVPVYGLGSHADGRPYYAMRFIRGRSLQQAIDHYFKAAKEGANASDQQLEFHQLLRRFIDVCNAIDYAHNRSVIHRDLKPGNVMLGDYGETLVVDWGIAKSVTVTGSLFKTPLEPLQPTATGDASQTMMGVAIGTPQFMSPEQAMGKLDELGPGSDIYSLGATLYCLLTGVAAFTSRDLNTVLKQVKSGTFPPPRQVNAQVPKPLNAICLKAMSLQPALRYGSARALAEDIEHWLADEPVAAYEENRWEKIGRWVRHNQARAQAIGVTVIVVAVVSLVAAFLIDQSRRAETEALRKLKIANDQEIQARKQEAAAKEEALRRSRQTREAIDTLLSSVSNALDEFPGMQEARRRLLERAAQDYARLAEEKSADRELQAEAGRSFMQLADVQAKLKSIDKARAALVQADAIWQKVLSGGSGVDPDYRRDFAVTKTKQGLLESDAADNEKASFYFHQAIADLRNLVRDVPRNVDYQDALGTALIGLGRSERRAGNQRMSENALQEALSIFQALLRQEPHSIRLLVATSHAERDYAEHLLDSGKALEAVRIYEAAIELLDELVTEFPNEPEYFAQRATTRINLAEALRSLGRWKLVVSNYESSVTDLQEVVRARPDVPTHRENLAVARTNLGQSLRKLGNNSAAVPVLQKALENFGELSASYPLPRYVEAIGNTRTSLAQVLSDLGQHEAALELINTALADYAELIDLDPNSAPYLEGIGIAQSNRGRILARNADLAGGVQAFEAAIAALKSAEQKDPKTARIADNLAWAWTHQAQVQFAAGQAMPARDAFQAALVIRWKLLIQQPESRQYQDSMAWLLATCPIEELRDLKKSLELADQTTRDVPDSTQYWLTLGAARLLRQQPAPALKALTQSANLRGQEDGVTLCLLAIAEMQLKHPAEAEKYLASAKAWQQAQKPADEELGYWIKQAESAVSAK